MKKVLIALMSVALLGGMSSCDKWLDVDADTRVGENIMFKNSSGMRIALNGIYNSLGDATLYGKELTWGVTSALSRDYNDARLPYSHRYMIYEGEWYETYSRPSIDPIWKKAYNTLANVNNLLQAVEKQEESFFEWGKLERNMFIAELRGIRALLHFDMLRLFAPAPIKDDGKAYIPYVEKYPEYQPKKLTVSETMDKIEADLIAACDILVDIDTSSTETDENVGPYGIYSGQSRFMSSWVSSVKKGQWFAQRGTRMNYIAAKALLVRLYMWKGDKANAIEASKFFQYKKWFNLASSNSWATSGNKLYYDFCFAAYNTDLEEIYTKACGTSTNKYFQYDNNFFNGLYTADKDDYRGKLMQAVTNDYRSMKWLWPANPNDNVKQEMSLAPVIKLAEVYLSLVEAYADTDLTKAIKLLQDFRKKRNAKRTLSDSMTKDELMKELELEWAREFQSEGQRFFCYKRLNKAVYQGENKDRYDYDAIDCWVLQQPLQEDSYNSL